MTNLLFIAADDLCHLDRMLRVLIRGYDMPNLRRLMNSGTDFDRSYCIVPVCEPARTAVMSGMSPAETRSFDLSEGWKDILHPRHMWQYRLREAGYYIGTVGKIYHGYAPEPGWVYDALYDNAPFSEEPIQPKTGGVYTGGLYGDVFENETDWYDKRMADLTIQHLTTYAEDRPFAWFCGFHHPHLEWVTPKRIHDLISIDDVILPEDWNGGWHTFPFAQQFMGEGTNGFGPDPALWTDANKLYARRTIHNYAAGALWMDEQLGRVLDALEASPFAADTIVTFYSDHGYHLSDRDRWHKFTLYEQAACAPMAIKVPGQAPRKVETPVSHIDLGATIMDYCGIPIPEGFRGISLRPWIEGQTPALRPIPTFWYGSSSVAIGTKRTTVYQDGTSEMYDLVDDPWATTDVSKTDPDFEAHREIAINAAYDWGFLIVEEGIDTSRPSELQSFLGTVPTDQRFATSFVALGDFNSSKGRSPGYQRMWGANANVGGAVRMPPHIEDYSVMGREALNIILQANALNNTIRIENNENQLLTAYLGDGDDEIKDPTRARVIAYGEGGNDLLRGGQGNPNQLYGGTGNDTLAGNSRDDTLDGGEGDDLVGGGPGNDYILASAGSDTITGDTGNDTIVVTGGAHLISGGAGNDTFRIGRTGRVNTITDFATGDVLDLVDWAPIGPASVTQVGADVEVTAALEKIVCRNTTAAVVKAAITGVMT
ncbi:sulfatase-like hydrolase/transferase [Falsirhodobacter sp. 1013]|uniref:sulfatase-like hydrolase/transferase n=1 Tax=Falsirhodobacter sp. 1013 TaxID=3417566 RepID=UPI003EB8911F